MIQNEIKYIKSSIEKPLNKELIKDFVELYKQSDPLFFNLIQKKRININTYLKNLINKKNSSLESFYLIKKQENLVGFYNLNTNNSISFKNLNNIMILKKNLNGQEFKLIQSVLLENFKLSKLPKKSVYVDRIVISKEFKFKGYGKMILKKIILESNYKKLSLHVNKINQNAIKFYFRNGFSVYDENTNYYTLIYKK